MAHGDHPTTAASGTTRTVTGFLRTQGTRRGAPDAVVPAVYDRLRRIARRALRGERPGHTLTPTALAHEAYLRLLRLDRIEWRDRDHFFAAAMQTMRRVLVDHAVARRAQKRGGGRATAIREGDAASRVAPEEVAAVHEALARLGRIAPVAARIVDCRVFLGMTIEETASALELSPATIKRHWTAARAWLTRELTGGARRG